EGGNQSHRAREYPHPRPLPARGRGDSVLAGASVSLLEGYASMDQGAFPKPPLLEVKGLTKTFAALRALDQVDFSLRAGEIHALLGENGAGKSTLIKVITGVLSRDAGTVLLDASEIAPRTAREALDAGIATVYQEVNLLPNLSVAKNLYLGREPTRFGIIRDGEMKRRAKALLEGFG